MGMSDVAAYKEATGCSQENAEKHACRFRQNIHCLRALEGAKVEAADGLKLTVNQRLGLLASIAINGGAHERIRAVREYSQLNGDYKKIGGTDDSKAGKVGLADVIAAAQHKEKR